MFTLAVRAMVSGVERERESHAGCHRLAPTLAASALLIGEQRRGVLALWRCRRYHRCMQRLGPYILSQVRALALALTRSRARRQAKSASCAALA
jgi:hypothetical protein